MDKATQIHKKKWTNKQTLTDTKNTMIHNNAYAHKFRLKTNNESKKSSKQTTL